MKFTIIDAGNFKLDGGAMFGVVPKLMWSRLNPPDEDNLCTWSMRSLLLETTTRKILIDTGIGNKQDEKFRSHFHPTSPMGVTASLRKNTIEPEEITDVFLTHLHFDHCGGAVYKDDKGQFKLTFPNAAYWSNKKQWEWALDPNPREAASFLKENLLPLQQSEQLKFIEIDQEDADWIEGIKIRPVYGHTEAMMLPMIPYKNSKLIYCADLLPSSMHLGLPYVMSYDLRPLITIAEKERLLAEALEKDYYLFYEHDPEVALSGVKINDRNKIVPANPQASF